jgi:uncharacterized protein YutE (UPF0331/DUF86 family)
MDSERLRRYIDKVEHIEERIEDIRTWLNEIEDIREMDKKTRLAVYKAMQEAVEAATDAVAMILKDEGKLPKDDYTNIEKIFELNIIDKRAKEALIEADGLRNRLVHEYNELNDEIALESIQCLLVPIEEFIEAVKKWMRKRE